MQGPNQRLDTVVPMDVYTIEKTTLTERVTALETQREKDADHPPPPGDGWSASSSPWSSPCSRTWRLP
ncbi:hypothetical protein [Streptomyces xantholiticus]|uniref:hypothetical protein n=1 Tax=Streptomyces xantholiticus TaxID=68285 RepID=UPI00167844EF|nr:hypothetical protein [Streptomyces xantholiticus]GGW74692.1 hypothetical protein GCM10010381_69300 [Streptomyces xantholiticus]